MKTNVVDSAPSTRRLKVAVLNRIFATTGGGAERYSIAVVEQLAERHDIHVFAQEIDHEWPGVTYHRIPCLSKKPRWLNQLWYAYATWRATGTGFDIVHSHENTWHGNVHTMHVKTVKRSLLGGRNGYQRALRWLKVALNPRLITYLVLERARMSARQDGAIVAVSQALQEELTAQYPIATPHIDVITPGVAPPKRVLTQEQARALVGIPVEGRYVLFVANDYARKGLTTLLEALRGMDGVRLLVVGHPVQTVRYQTLAGTLGVQDRVHFLGTLQDMSPAYFAANVLAHPTLEDSFAMVVLEAMAHGLPVVVSSGTYCGISSLLSHQVNALILEQPQDAQQLRLLLLQALGDDKGGGALHLAALAFAQQHSWQGAAQVYERIYFQLAR
ncbi:MAG: glycosyltransferase family 4 protein [Burkholderiaceae bacterium]